MSRNLAPFGRPSAAPWCVRRCGPRWVARRHGQRIGARQRGDAVVEAPFREAMTDSAAGIRKAESEGGPEKSMVKYHQ